MTGRRSYSNQQVFTRHRQWRLTLPTQMSLPGLHSFSEETPVIVDITKIAALHGPPTTPLPLHALRPHNNDSNNVDGDSDSNDDGAATAFTVTMVQRRLVSSSRPPPSSQVTSSSRAAASRPSTPSSVAPRRPSELSPRRASFKSPHPRPCAPAQSPREPESASKAGSKAKCRRDPSPPQRNGKCSKANEGASGTSTASDPVQRSPSPRPAFMSLLQPDPASQLTPSAEAAPSKTPRSKQDHATSRAKVLSTRAAKARGNRAAVTNDNDDMATKPVSGSRPVTPVEDPGCQSPSYENLSKPAPSKTTRSKQDLATSRTKALSTRAAKAKSNRSMVTDGDDNVAAQPVSGSCPVTPIEDPGCQSPRWGAQIQVRMVTSSFERTCPPSQDDVFQVRPHFIICQGSIDTGSQGQGQPFHNGRRRGCPVAAQVAFGDPAEDPGHESPDQAGMVPSSSEHSDDDDKSHLHLQGKRPTRIDLIKAIAGVAKSEQPSKEDIKSIITERKSKCSMKAA
ncbi:hypothetical protein EDB85DRAFT_2149951 [Lactarius pseudohatsudake]|nr:hypothetical protein EDB85DRAFT_2149951 [Lactarius pseudohatsudake]